MNSFRLWFGVMLIALPFVTGCSGKSESEEEVAEPETFKLSVKVESELDFYKHNVVASIFDGRLTGEIRRARPAIQKKPSGRDAWPVGRFQKAIQRLVVDSQPMQGLEVQPGGVVEFAGMNPGQYLVIVGIPSMRGARDGKILPREWPELLSTTYSVDYSGFEGSVAAQIIWLLEITVVDKDLSIRLADADKITYPVNEVDLAASRLFSRAYQTVLTCDSKIAALESKREAKDTIARESGQPLHVLEVRDVEAEITELQNERQQALTPLVEAIKAMQSPKSKTVTE